MRPRGMLRDDLLALGALTLHRTFQLRHLIPLSRSPSVLGDQGGDQAQQSVKAEQ